jgi:hypothetical protein
MGKGIVKLGEGNWAVKDGNLLAAKETNGRFKNAEFTVTRGTRATYVGRDGLIKESNLQDTNLVPSIITTEDNNGGVINYISSNIYSSTSDGTSASSIRPKFDFNTENGKTYKLIITPTGAITGTVNFDFYDGSSYLFSNYDFTTTKEIYFTDNGGVFGAFDGQQTYSIDSFTISVQEIKTDTPRIDFTDNTDGHLLLEPQSTNLITYSEDFSEWNNSTTSDATSVINSPDGTQNATTLTATTGNGSVNHMITSDDFIIASGDITASIFAKKGTVDYLRLRFDGTTSNERAWYNLNNGTIEGEDSSGSAKIEDYGNGWYRCILTSSNNTASGNCGLQLFVQNTGGTQTSWEADGTENIHIWGGQVEQLEYPTSYIPTNGSTVTRDAETCTGAGEAADFNNSEGVLYAEIAALAEVNQGIAISNGTYDSRILFYFDTSGNIRGYIFASGNQFQQTTSGVDYKSLTKMAIKYSATSTKFYVNGNLIGTEDTSSTMPSVLNQLSLHDGGGGNKFYGRVKAIKVYKETDGIDLGTLTS